jgi:hypothetical protein
VGTIYHSQGRESAARKAYAKALALDPSLGNPKVNPHLIDNDLATSAMLYSYHHYREELQPEKEFEEPARIAGVLIDRPGSSPDAVATAGREAERPEGGITRGSGAPPDAGAQVDYENGGEAAAVEKGEPIDDDGSGSRVLTSRDLDPGSASGQIVGGGTPARVGVGGIKGGGGQITSGNRGRTRDTQQPLRPTLRPPPFASGGTTPQDIDPPAAFVPTSDSTGMMETSLVEIDELG